MSLLFSVGGYLSKYGWIILKCLFFIGHALDTQNNDACKKIDLKILTSGQMADIL